ncbi:MAG: DinB family protein [Candidatus Limnocylindrales bacterium]
MTADWIAALEPGAPDVVAAWRGIDEGRLISVRREVRRRAGAGTAEAVAAQLATLADALSVIVGDLSDDDLRRDGGEGGWNVAQAVGHDAESRAGLSLAAAKAAAGQWPPDAPSVVQGIPGPADADHATLLRKIAQSQRIVERAARTVAGHEMEPCPLDHPQVGRLRCGEWLLFAGVHDLMHLDQLHGLTARKESPS